MVPARAGVVPISDPGNGSAKGGPRACGGGPCFQLTLLPGTEWSPRLRGVPGGQVAAPHARTMVPRMRPDALSPGLGPGTSGNPAEKAAGRLRRDGGLAGREALPGRRWR